jgi:RNA polymerase sigma factor (sigma-70 family)
LKFDNNRGVSFDAWLSVVVNNLCHDWRRQQFGRRRAPRAIQNMDLFDQDVYRLKFVKRLDLPTCFNLLRVENPGLTEQALSESLGRVHNSLSSHQRWRLSFTNRPSEQRMIPYQADQVPIENSNDPDPGPFEFTRQAGEIKALERALSRLTSEQQLALRLRYKEFLSLRDVANIMRLDNIHQARRRIDKALQQLKQYLPGKGT